MTSPRLPSGRPKGCVDSVQRKLRTDQIGQIPVRAKCPCGRLHTVMLNPEQIEPGITPRLYCRDHQGRGYFSGSIFELPGHILANRASHGVAI
ncbi:MAG: hypothetical protein ABIJ57_07240 [Pseudomonadota bacterium]